MTFVIGGPHLIKIGPDDTSFEAFVIGGKLFASSSKGSDSEGTDCDDKTDVALKKNSVKSYNSSEAHLIIFSYREQSDVGSITDDRLAETMRQMKVDESSIENQSEPSHAHEKKSGTNKRIAYSYKIIQSMTKGITSMTSPCPNDGSINSIRLLLSLKRISPTDYCLGPTEAKSSGPEPKAKTSTVTFLPAYNISSPEICCRLSKVLGIPVQSGDSSFPPRGNNRWSFYSKAEADEFFASLQSTIPAKSIDRADGSRKKKSSRKLSGLVITVRRTSLSAANVPVAYEVVDEKSCIKRRRGNTASFDASDEDAPMKKIKREDLNSSKMSSLEAIATTYASDESPDRNSEKRAYKTEPEVEEFYFIQPCDFKLLTDYLVLVFAQVKKGIMNAADLAKANRKTVKCSVGFPGLRCRHCGGHEKGSYFPSCSKNLQAVPPTLHAHLMKCPACPSKVKRALKLTKSEHKYQVLTRAAGSQAIFYNQLWDRVQSVEFRGGGDLATHAVKEHLDLIFEQCKYPKLTHTNEMDHDEVVAVPNVVSYDRETLDGISDESNINCQVESTNNFIQTITPNDVDYDDDFAEALNLLRRAPTPDRDMTFCEDPPPDDVNITPQPISKAAKKTGGESYHNGEIVASGHEKVKEPSKAKASKKSAAKMDSAKKKKAAGVENKLTRKFTRNDEILFIRGILKHGKRWKVIWDASPNLQHIMHSALKDRARSQRFKTILERAEADPSLLERPDELCGDENQPEYTEETSTRASPLELNDSFGSEVISYFTREETSLSQFRPMQEQPYAFQESDIDEFYRASGHTSSSTFEDSALASLKEGH